MLVDRSLTRLAWGQRSLSLGEYPLLMGIVNVTPDSFSDGGQFFDPNRAVDHALKLVDEGANWLDVGGESTRPGATPVGDAEELRRVLPVIEGISAQTDTPISIDTYKASVAREAIEAGASIINDVTGFRDPAMVEVAAATKTACIVMHMRGTPADMMEQTEYTEVVADLIEYFRERLARLSAAGVELERTILDPGIGFAKRRLDNLRLLNRLHEFASLGRPVLLGASRKRIIGEITGRGEAGRIHGTIASSVLAYLKGVHILRVHDVGAVADALKIARAIEVEGAT
ncbi:dihydropteroate synthase [bacterium]|nr:dihydropteroate synthase [bacterium]